MKIWRHKKLAALAGVLILFSVLFLEGCGQRGLGFGVVLWSNNEGQVPTGSVVQVIDQSRINGTYTCLYQAERNGKRATERLTLDTWRLQFFRSRNDAVAYQRNFHAYDTKFARSQVNALPVRSTEDAQSDMVYKLRSGEVIKVLDRSADQVTLGDLTAHWYHVLTDTGVSGWVFGYLLTVYDSRSPQVAESDASQTDPVLQNILTTAWRPAAFADMISSGQFDLKKFDPQYGFFAVPDAQRFTLVLPDYSAQFDYTHLTRLDATRYSADGTSLQIAVENDHSISAQYSKNGNLVTTKLVKVDQDINKLIKDEIDRRNALYKRFLDAGPTLSSNAYGTITLAPDKTFAWTGYQKLLSGVIPPTVSGRGTAGFPLYLDRSIKTSYDGVITFTMQGNGTSVDVSFLYAFAAGGVRFEYVPSANIKDNVVLRQSASPLIIFFTFRSAT